MVTNFKINRFDHLIAFPKKEGDGAIAFHCENLEVAELSKEAWIEFLKLSSPFDDQCDDQSAFDSLKEWNNSTLEMISNFQSQKIKKNSIQSLSINVTQLCNLHCIYCAAGGDGTYKDPVQKIQIEKALPQIQFFISKLQANDSFKITFIGGEPLLYPEGICAIAEYTKKIAAELNIQTQFIIVTNGTLIQPSMLQLFNSFKPSITVSLDGPSSVNDILRPQKNGKGSTSKTLDGLKLLLTNRESLGPIGVSGVFGANNLDLETAYHFYSDLGVDWFDFVFDHLETSTEISRQFTEQLKKVANLAFQKNKELGLRKIRFFDTQFQMLDAQKKSKNHCGAGKTFLVSDAKQNLYACPWLIGEKSQMVGHGTELWSDKLDPFQKDFINKLDCQNCWVKNLCGGGCLFMHKNKTGQIESVDTNFCERIQDLIAETLVYYKQCRNEVFYEKK